MSGSSPSSNSCYQCGGLGCHHCGFAPHKTKERSLRSIDIVLTVGDFTLSVYDERSFWLERDDGDGVEVMNSDFAAILENVFMERA